jgi:CubicO group peptidase (beta-lactamase class C family)
MCFTLEVQFQRNPAYQFEITARDLARFGLLYLRRGRWNEKQIVPEAWVEKSSHANEMLKVNGVEVGRYEYLWWVEYGNVHFPEATLPGMFSARGAGGHYLLIIPTLDLIIVHRTDTDPPVKDGGCIVGAGIGVVQDGLAAPHRFDVFAEHADDAAGSGCAQ